MSKKVYELAKELEMESKELLEKINSMGIEAKSHNSVISDIDATAIGNMIQHNRKKASETKIVKVAPTNVNKSKDDEVKIAVKHADINAMIAKDKGEPRGRMEQKPMQARPTSAVASPPKGTPVPRSASMQPPQGVPLPKSASKQPEKAPEEITEPLAVTRKIEPEVQPPKKPVEQSVKELAPEKPKEEAKVVVEEKIEPKAEPKTEPKTEPRAEAPKPDYRPSNQTPYRDRTANPNERRGDRPQSNYGGNRPAPSGGNRPAQYGGNRPAPYGGNRPAPSGGNRPAPTDGSRPAPPRQKPVTTEAAAAAQKKGKKEKTDYEKRDRVDGKKDVRKPFTDSNRSMEKPTLKKSRRKADRNVEPETKINIEELAPGTKIINVPITVKGLSEQINKTSSDIIMALMKLGVMANVNQNLDEDTVLLLGESLGVSIVIDKISEETVEVGLETFEDKEEDLTKRPPIITVMGHVDHGKTSLLDAIRKTNVTATESGGITQHIGASEVTINGQRIVFLDTPGHEAFTTMRARGAHVTDIAVLVVAADDSVKPQTIESISHAKAAGVPIIVAINKVDKEGANPERVKQDLANLPENFVLVEEYGGDTISVPVSAKTGEGIVTLLEMILLQAEILELKANPNRLAIGTVIEARLDKAKGPVATLLVQNGTLQSGMSVVAGTSSGRIRAMTNDKGETIRKAGPATAVEILGLTDVPEAGDEFRAVKEDKVAREIAEQRKLKVREEVMVRNSSVTLEQLFSQIQAGEIKELNLIVKADVQGSVGALTQSLEKLQTENVKVRIIHSGVGTVTESDIMLANTSNAIIIGFNVRPSTNITTMAEREKVEIRTYRVIYEIIDDIEAAMKGMLDPVYKEVVMGKIEIRETFKVPGVGIIGGAYVLEGKVQRNAQIRLVRDGIVIHEGKISSLKRFKDDAKEVAQGYECGIGIENYNDIKESDIIEAFKMEEIERK